MPGNTLRFADAPLEAGKLLFASFGGFGVLGAELPASGTHGPSFLLDDLDEGDEDTELRPRITELPSAGSFEADEFGALALIGAPAGTYTFKYMPIVGVTVLGEATETIVIGSTPVACAALLPPLAWDGAAALSSATLVSTAAQLPALAWSGAAALHAATPVQCAALLPALAWDGAAALSSATLVSTAAQLPALAWSGAAALHAATPVTCAAQLPALAWDGAVNLALQTPVWMAAQLPPLQWAGTVALQAWTPVQCAALLPALTWDGAIGGGVVEVVRLRCPMTLTVALRCPVMARVDLATPIELEVL